MASRQMQPLNLSDFTGGLNLRADAFQLQDNESPEMLNVDVDPRGGVRSRRSWERWNSVAISGTWAPKRLHIFEQPDGGRDVILVNGTDVLTAATGTFAALSDGSGAISALADGHGADFADWGSYVYMVCGRGEASRRWAGSSTATAMGESGPSWQDDYTAPSTNWMPSADFATTYQGYMVVASTQEDGNDYQNRIRFSHPNNPENWAELDFIDIKGGGARITGLAAFSDHVVVFKTNSVWAIYGNDADSFTPVNITMALGAVHRNAIALSDEGAYFYSHPNGVHCYRPGEGIDEVSPQLRPIIDSGELNKDRLDKLWLGVHARRVWFSCPYQRNALVTTTKASFVLDPMVQSWTLYRDADGDGVGPFATGGNQGDGALLLAAHVTHPYVLELDKSSDAFDSIDVDEVGFETLYATKWLHAGWPSLQKSWRRPDYIVTEVSAAHTLTVEVMRDYDEANPKSRHTVQVETGGTGVVWGTGTWGTGTWGAGARGAHIEKGGSVGLARAVQLRFSGEVGKPWGLNAVVMKFRNRRFR